jgi:hypothetical protein
VHWRRFKAQLTLGRRKRRSAGVCGVSLIVSNYDAIKQKHDCIKHRNRKKQRATKERINEPVLNPATCPALMMTWRAKTKLQPHLWLPRVALVISVRASLNASL